ncbi:MAG: beta-ketoacyl synthase chain length factor [Chitinophagaceae bacterium]
MDLYIRATGNISPQHTFGKSLLTEQTAYTGNRLNSIDPDYSKLFDPKMIRRMSRIIKMGVGAAMDCLQEAGIKQPDAIITGTAYGCLQDTEVFLKRLVEFKEEMLTPTAFIQSTHNTVGGQIALMLQCHNYNNTFVHRGFSFESALLDAMMMIEEGDAKNVLVGGLDEITDTSHAILNRMGQYKQHAVSNTDLLTDTSKGTIAGEGAAFFLLSNEAAADNYALLNGLHTFYKPASVADIEKEITSFLVSQGLSINDIDLVITGRNGDSKNDTVYNTLASSLFSNITAITFKQLCGEYPTVGSFALWLAAGIVKEQHLPAAISDQKLSRPIQRILIYNHSQQIHHSLMLVSAC